METLAAMSMDVDGPTEKGCNSKHTPYRFIWTPENKSRAYTVHILTENESRLVIESNLIHKDSPSAFWPRRITDVDSLLVETILRMPRYV